MKDGTCNRCGDPCPPTEIPPHLTGIYRTLLERTPLICSTCVERDEASERERDRIAAERSRRERLKARRDASGVPTMLRALTWEHVRDNRPDVLAAAQEWAAGMALGLLLTGAVGRGKTWLAAAAANAHIELWPVRWFSTPALLAQLGLAFGDDRREDALDALAGSQALVLDDIDKAKASEYAAQQLFLAIDSRLTAGVPLLVTTNLGLDALAAKFPEPFGDAIVSRLVGYCEAFALQGHDRRLQRLAS